MTSVARKRFAGERISRLWILRNHFLAALFIALVSSVSYQWLWPVGDMNGVVNGNGGAAQAATSGPFAIHGNATEPISPGVTAPLDLSLTNPQDVPMSVTDLSVTVRRVSEPNADDAHPCVVGDFTVEQASRNLEITLPSRATSALSSLRVARASLPSVGMLERSVNQDGCKGAALTLGYAASGTLNK